jgi:outer membrane lipopolysaccharide assembly protein LptE/RlpB
MSDSFDSIRNQTDSPSLLKNKFIKITMKENSGIQNSHDIILENRFTLTDSAKTKDIPSLELSSINIG